MSLTICIRYSWKFHLGTKMTVRSMSFILTNSPSRKLLVSSKLGSGDLLKFRFSGRPRWWTQRLARTRVHVEVHPGPGEGSTGCSSPASQKATSRRATSSKGCRRSSAQVPTRNEKTKNSSHARSGEAKDSAASCQSNIFASHDSKPDTVSSGESKPTLFWVFISWLLTKIFSLLLHSSWKRTLTTRCRTFPLQNHPRDLLVLHRFQSNRRGTTRSRICRSTSQMVTTTVHNTVKTLNQ